MTQRIIYTNEKGGVSVIVPADCGLSIQEIAEKDVPSGSTYEIVDIASIPSDRTFRGAWRKGAGKVDTDLPTAKLIAHEKRRAKRSEEYMVVDADNMNVLVSPAAQTQRNAIGIKYDIIQAKLQDSTSVALLKTHMVGENLL